MSATSFVNHLITDIRIASGMALGTMATGTMKVLEWIPDDVGKLTAVVGLVLSCVLIVSHTFNGRAQYRKTMLELEKIRLSDGSSEGH